MCACFFASRRRHTRGALVTGVQTCALPIFTAHLREDRRHIRDDDISVLMAALAIPLNLEMAATQEMLEIAVRHRPHAACIVPEKRLEQTTEGGLDAAGQFEQLAPIVSALSTAGISCSHFNETSHTNINQPTTLHT